MKTTWHGKSWKVNKLYILFNVTLNICSSEWTNNVLKYLLIKSLWGHFEVQNNWVALLIIWRLSALCSLVLFWVLFVLFCRIKHYYTFTKLSSFNTRRLDRLKTHLPYNFQLFPHQDSFQNLRLQSQLFAFSYVIKLYSSFNPGPIIFLAPFICIS